MRPSIAVACSRSSEFVENGVGVVGSEKHDEGEEHAAADAASERLDDCVGGKESLEVDQKNEN